MTMLFPRYFRAKSSNTSQARKRYKPLRQSRKIVSVIALPRKISRAYMRLSVSPLAIKPASFQAARAANPKRAAGTSGLLRDSLDAISGRIDAISNGGPASGNPRNYDGRSLERKPESGRPRAERPLSAWLWLRQKAHPAQDARARRASFPREIRECGVPTRVIGKQQTTGAEAGICLPEFPNHVLVGMQTIVDEYVDAFELRQQLRQDL